MNSIFLQHQRVTHGNRWATSYPLEIASTSKTNDDASDEESEVNFLAPLLERNEHPTTFCLADKNLGTVRFCGSHMFVPSFLAHVHSLEKYFMVLCGDISTKESCMVGQPVTSRCRL
jgi:hypothetical protein